MTYLMIWQIEKNSLQLQEIMECKEDSIHGRGCRGAMIPAKMSSEPQDLQNYLQAPQNWSPSLSDVTKPPAILSPRPAFWSPLVVFIFGLNLLA